MKLLFNHRKQLYSSFVLLFEGANGTTNSVSPVPCFLYLFLLYLLYLHCISNTFPFETALHFLLPPDVITSLAYYANEFLSLLFFFFDSYIFYIPFFLS